MCNCNGLVVPKETQYIGTAKDEILWYRLPIVAGEVDWQSRLNGRVGDVHGFCVRFGSVLVIH
jgi:hypothetical protein